jgi:hypothetical protein
LGHPFEVAKNVGVLLGTATAIGYACGYLVLRARSQALGTDPEFKLVDQVYVFAGVRFLVTTLIVVLVLAPVILTVRWVAVAALRALPEPMEAPIQWIALIVVAMMTLLSMSIFAVNGVLLSEGELPRAGLAGAVLGEADGLRLRLGLTLALVLLAGLSALWLHARVSAGQSTFAWILAGVVSLQAFMLPIYHGTLIADRRVRVLAELPAGMRGLVTPVAIVDRTADRATLLGRDGDGRRGLATVALKDLDGLPVHAVMPLEDFLGQIAAGDRESGMRASWVKVADAGTTTEGAIVADEITGFAKGFYGALVGYFGMVLESIGSLGGGPSGPGELWAVELDPSGRPSAPRRVGDVADVSWPVVGADRASFVALQAGRVVRLDQSGAVTEILAEGVGWRKLLGEQADGSVLGLLRRDGETRPARIGANGSVQVGDAPAGDDEKRALARLQQDARAYSGDRALLVDRSERGGRGFDVFLRTPDGTFNLSDCGDDYCGQASLSPDQRRVVFIRASRY